MGKTNRIAKTFIRYIEAKGEKTQNKRFDERLLKTAKLVRFVDGAARRRREEEQNIYSKYKLQF